MSCMNCNNNGNVEGIENTNNGSRCRNGADCPRFFPKTIEETLKRLVCEHVVLTFVNGCKERVKIECVTDKLVVVREQNAFRFISIDCICAVTASGETILDSLIGNCDN